MGINMAKSDFFLKQIKHYFGRKARDPFSLLESENSFKRWVFPAVITPSEEAQKNHKKVARSFCFTLPRDFNIYAAPEIEFLPDKFICGIVLHEVGHLLLPRKRGETMEAVELKVDTWCVSLGFGYTYDDLRLKDGRMAYSLQHVSGEGLRKVKGYQIDCRAP